MKLSIKILSLVLAVLTVACMIVSCNAEKGKTDSESNSENIVTNNDYVSKLKLDMSTNSAKQQVTVENFVDGDTTHFHVPTTLVETGILKARYLAIDTPESTGRIEEWGKKAKDFTRSKLESAVSIIIESDDEKWNLDSTGGRYLVWVWYKPSENAEYRNLNLEILQNGLAVASKTANNRYGDICMDALSQAKAQKLYVHSDEKDPEFFYGDAIELTLKELRTNIEDYNGKKIAFNGIVTKNNNNSAYVEYFDAEDNLYYGIPIYYGFNLNGKGLEILSVGNEVRIVGSVQYYENGGVYQISDVKYRVMQPDDPSNIKKLSDGHKPAYALTTADKFVNGKVSVTLSDGAVKEYKYSELTLDSSISMTGLVVKSIYTTNDPESSSKGAMTLTCESDGIQVTVRTTVLYDKDGKVVTESLFEGKTIDVKGLVGYFKGTYQIKVFSVDDIIIK